MKEPETYNGSSQTDKIKIRLEGTPESVKSAVAVLCITEIKRDCGSPLSIDAGGNRTRRIYPPEDIC